ncbi:hypothetical protein Ddye_014322 [Dipteronia dyeriana]|uniref:Ankyrin repeat protein n=1 Tax=Dipteronia dyeriana TaxID=168575 RepID=A0AAD9X7P4_9ROSI|nr:hypothetical protein Ddye_014322 [Dipteronia dyeriana]
MTLINQNREHWGVDTTTDQTLPFATETHIPQAMLQKEVIHTIVGSPIVRELWKENRYHKFAYDLARKLTRKDKSWEQSIRGSTDTAYEADKDKSLEQNITGSTTTLNEAVKDKEEKEEKDRSPLFAATKAGNAEFVRMILEEHPQVLEYTNHRNQNILHVAVRYRQKEIFAYVTKRRVPMLRLVRRFDGNTILHFAADTKHYTGGTSSGPAYQLQEELEWFSVRIIITIPLYLTSFHK